MLSFKSDLLRDLKGTKYLYITNQKHQRKQQHVMITGDAAVASIVAIAMVEWRAQWWSGTQYVPCHPSRRWIG